MTHESHATPDSLYYIMADAKKLIAQIKKDDPKMIDHALEKYKGERAENWIKNNSKSKPHTIGLFAFNENVNKKEKLTLSEGWAGNLILIQELGLPYVPVAVHKWPEDDDQHIERLQRLVGSSQAVAQAA